MMQPQGTVVPAAPKPPSTLLQRAVAVAAGPLLGFAVNLTLVPTGIIVGNWLLDPFTQSILTVFCLGFWPTLLAGINREFGLLDAIVTSTSSLLLWIIITPLLGPLWHVGIAFPSIPIMISSPALICAFVAGIYLGYRTIRTDES